VPCAATAQTRFYFHCVPTWARLGIGLSRASARPQSMYNQNRSLRSICTDKRARIQPPTRLQSRHSLNKVGDGLPGAGQASAGPFSSRSPTPLPSWLFCRMICTPTRFITRRFERCSPYRSEIICISENYHSPSFLGIHWLYKELSRVLANYVGGNPCPTPVSTGSNRSR
jgi:hypothetical protein